MEMLWERKTVESTVDIESSLSLSLSLLRTARGAAAILVAILLIVCLTTRTASAGNWSPPSFDDKYYHLAGDDIADLARKLYAYKTIMACAKLGRSGKYDYYQDDGYKGSWITLDDVVHASKGKNGYKSGIRYAVTGEGRNNYGGGMADLDPRQRIECDIPELTQMAGEGRDWLKNKILDQIKKSGDRPSITVSSEPVSRNWKDIYFAKGSAGNASLYDVVKEDNYDLYGIAGHI